MDPKLAALFARKKKEQDEHDEEGFAQPAPATTKSKPAITPSLRRRVEPSAPCPETAGAAETAGVAETAGAAAAAPHSDQLVTPTEGLAASASGEGRTVCAIHIYKHAYTNTQAHRHTCT